MRGAGLFAGHASGAAGLSWLRDRSIPRRTGNEPRSPALPRAQCEAARRRNRRHMPSRFLGTPQVYRDRHRRQFLRQPQSRSAPRGLGLAYAAVARLRRRRLVEPTIRNAVRRRSHPTGRRIAQANAMARPGYPRSRNRFLSTVDRRAVGRAPRRPGKAPRAAANLAGDRRTARPGGTLDARVGRGDPFGAAGRGPRRAVGDPLGGRGAAGIGSRPGDERSPNCGSCRRRACNEAHFRLPRPQPHDRTSGGRRARCRWRRT